MTAEYVTQYLITAKPIRSKHIADIILWIQICLTKLVLIRVVSGFSNRFGFNNSLTPI